MIHDHQPVEKVYPGVTSTGVAAENAVVYSMDLKKNKIEKFTGVTILCHIVPALGNIRWDLARKELFAVTLTGGRMYLPNTPGVVKRVPNSVKFFWLEHEDDEKAVEIFNQLLDELVAESQEKIDQEYFKIAQCGACRLSLHELSESLKKEEE